MYYMGCVTITSLATYAFNAIMYLSRASTRGRYSRIVGVTSGAPAWWHANLCEDQRPANLNKNEKTKTPGKILAGDGRRPPARSLPGTPANSRQDPCRGRPRDASKTLVGGICGAEARPTPTNVSLPHTHSDAATSAPTRLHY